MQTFGSWSSRNSWQAGQTHRPLLSEPVGGDHIAGVSLWSWQTRYARPSWRSGDSSTSWVTSFTLCPVASSHSSRARRSVLAGETWKSWCSWKSWQSRRPSYSFWTTQSLRSITTLLSSGSDRPFRSRESWDSWLSGETRETPLTLGTFNSTAVAFGSHTSVAGRRVGPLHRDAQGEEEQRHGELSQALQVFNHLEGGIKQGSDRANTQKLCGSLLACHSPAAPPAHSP